MPRQSSVTEEKARDLLKTFLESLSRRPLLTFLKLYLPKEFPHALANTKALDLTPEPDSIGRSRADLVIKDQTTAFCLEVKVDDDEKIGQYIKYRDHLRHEGYTVHLGGLVSHFKRVGCKNDNEPFFQLLQIPRLLWSEVLNAFEAEFSRFQEFKTFRDNLLSIAPHIGNRPRPSIPDLRKTRRDPAALEDNWTLARFFEDLTARFEGWDSVPIKDGNAPYSLHLGKPEWGPLFHEASCRRIVMGFNNGRKSQRIPGPYFAPDVMLWNRAWFCNKPWFLQYRKPIASYFHNLHFRITRNYRDHYTVDWPPPFQDADKLHFAGAFWENHFSLTHSECVRLGWNRSLDRLEAEIRKLADMVDNIAPRLNTKPPHSV